MIPFSEEGAGCFFLQDEIKKGMLKIITEKKW
jgi:hypothetical protein